MKVKTFYPVIISKNTEAILKEMETFGFSAKHAKSDVGFDIHSDVLKDEEGNRVAVSSADMPQTLTAIRVNVESFEEASKELVEMGFVQIGEKTENSTSIAAMFRSANGYFLVVSEHKN